MRHPVSAAEDRPGDGREPLLSGAPGNGVAHFAPDPAKNAALGDANDLSSMPDGADHLAGRIAARLVRLARDP
jgi:hypothetical protein